MALIGVLAPFARQQRTCTIQPTMPSGTIPCQEPVKKLYHQGQWLPALDSRPQHLPSPWNAPDAAVLDETGSTLLIATATALARTAAQAEVAVLMAVQRGYPEALRAVESAWREDKEPRLHLPAERNVALLLVLESGEVVCSANMEQYLEICAEGDLR